MGLGAVYALLGQVGFWLLNPPGGAAFYPPAGLALAVLVLTPRKTWPVWLAAFAIRKWGIRREEVVYSESLEPGGRLTITHEAQPGKREGRRAGRR